MALHKCAAIFTNPSIAFIAFSSCGINKFSWFAKKAPIFRFAWLPIAAMRAAAAFAGTKIAEYYTPCVFDNPCLFARCCFMRFFKVIIFMFPRTQD